MAPLLLLLSLVTAPATAKDLNGRLGLGFSQQFGGSGAMSAASLRFGVPTGKPTLNIGVEADVGVAIASGGTDFFAGGRALWGVVAEDNMNLYLGAGVGYLRQNVPTVDTTGASTSEPTNTVRVQPSLGAEFFLFGLENLGFTTELGLNVDLGTTTTVTTVGGAPAVGMHYYF